MSDPDSSVSRSSHADTSDPTVSVADSKKHFARNSISNLVFFVFNASTSLIMVPYLIRYLGIANYGMVALANSFVIYIQTLTIAVTGATARFVTLHAAKRDYEEARRYLNTQLIATIWLIAPLFPILGLLSYFVTRFLKIPSGQEHATQILIFCVCSSALATMITASFQVGIIVRQRFDLINILEIGNQIARYSTWLLLFSMLVPSIWQVWLWYLVGTTLVLISGWLVFNKLTPTLRPALHGFSWNRFAEVTGMGGWLAVEKVGALLYLGVDLLIINLMLGPSSVGKYATIMGFSIMLKSLSGTMANLIAHISIAFYAQKDWAKLISGMAQGVRFMSLGMAIVLGIVCGLSIPFLTVWLGPQYAWLHLLLWIMLSHQVVTSGIEPLLGVNYAANKVVVPGVAAVVGGLFKLVLAICLVRYARMGIYGPAVAVVAAFIAKNLIFQPIYAGRILKTSSWPFYKAMLPAVVVFAVLAALVNKLAQVVNLATLPRLGGTGLALFVLSTLLVYALALNSNDKRFFRQAMPWGRKAK